MHFQIIFFKIFRRRSKVLTTKNFLNFSNGNVKSTPGAQFSGYISVQPFLNSFGLIFYPKGKES